MTRLLLPALALLALLAPPVVADVVRTRDGLVLEGQVSRDDQGRYVVQTEGGRTILEASRVEEVHEGDGPRTTLTRMAKGLGKKDVQGWTRLALEAEAAGLGDLATDAYRRIVQMEPDHEAARRALGHEKLDGHWVAAAVARRKSGFVLYGGKWMLPAEVEVQARKAAKAMARAKDADRVRDVIRTLATGDEVMRQAARLALAETSDQELVGTALATLLDKEPAVRRTSARLLGEVGDEAALRPLIFSAARDLDRDVRGEALRAAASFGHDDLAIPFVRALGSSNPQLAAFAAEALAGLGDVRAIGYVVKRMTSHGSSSRNSVSFLNQVSYVRDYDVEIAQASNIANPDVATILEGVVLDVKVVGASFTKTWLEPLLVNAAAQLAGRDFKNRSDVLAWYAEAKDTLPDFPRDARRARKTGKVIGAQ